MERENKLKRMATALLLNDQLKQHLGSNANDPAQLSEMNSFKESLLEEDLNNLRELTETSSDSEQKSYATQFFRDELIKLNINQFDVKSSEDVDFKLIENLMIAQKATTNALLKSELNFDSDFINLKAYSIGSG